MPFCNRREADNPRLFPGRGNQFLEDISRLAVIYQTGFPVTSGQQKIVCLIPLCESVAGNEKINMFVRERDISEGTLIKPYVEKRLVNHDVVPCCITGQSYNLFRGGSEIREDVDWWKDKIFTVFSIRSTIKIVTAIEATKILSSQPIAGSS